MHCLEVEQGVPDLGRVVVLGRQDAGGVAVRAVGLLAGRHVVRPADLLLVQQVRQVGVCEVGRQRRLGEVVRVPRVLHAVEGAQTPAVRQRLRPHRVRRAVAVRELEVGVTGHGVLRVGARRRPSRDHVEV